MITLIERGFDLSRVTRNTAGDIFAASLVREVSRALAVYVVTPEVAAKSGFVFETKSSLATILKSSPHNVTYARAIAAWIGCGEWDLYPSRYNPPAPRQLTKMERFRIERRAFRHQFIKGPRAQAARSMAFALLAK